MPRELQGICHTPNCCGLQLAADNNYRGTGKPIYRKWCYSCYEERRAANAGLTTAEYSLRTKKNSATKAGFDNIKDHLNSKHPYRKYRKDYCENIDGRLGFICPTPTALYLEVSAILQVDHIDGNPHNHTKENCQTFCVLCHTYKSWTSDDMTTPGRKGLVEI